MKKKLLFAFLVLALNSFSIEGSIQSNVKIEPIFNQKYSKDNYSKFRYDRTNMSLTAYDLNLKFNDNFNTFATLKSSRNDIQVSDLNNLSVKKDERYNHDIMPKFGMNANFKFKDLISNTEIIYYLDDFWSKRLKNENNEIKDLEIGEYLENDKDKEKLGNILFTSKLNGKINNINIDSKIEYKANQLFRFDKDKSYFKFNIATNGQVNEKLEMNGNYDFKIDLNQMSKKFYNNKDLEYKEFPDYIVGDYVTYFKQILNYGLKYNLSNKNAILFSTDLEHYAFYAGGNTKEKPYKTYFNAFLPKFTISNETKIVDKLVEKLNLKNSVILNLDYKGAIFKADENRNDQFDGAISINPSYEMNIKYERDKDNEKLKTDVSASYGPKFAVYPIIVDKDDIYHELTQNININYVNNISSNSSFELDTKNKFIESIKKSKTPILKMNSNFSLNYKNQINDNLKFEGKLNNTFSMNTQKRSLHPDIMKNVVTLNTKLDYFILKNLKIETRLDFENISGFNYVLYSNGKKLNSIEESSYGKNILTNMTNVISLKNKLNYEKDINKELKFGTEMQLNAEISTLNLRNEKMYSYNINDISVEKEIPKVSDDMVTNTNVGGKIEIIPSIKFDYTPINKLELSSKIGMNLLFERKVIDKISDKDRVDDGQYGAIDKKFDFRHMKPVIELNVKYMW